jgi:hypothetical protein
MKRGKGKQRLKRGGLGLRLRIQDFNQSKLTEVAAPTFTFVGLFGSALLKICFSECDSSTLKRFPSSKTKL